MKRAFVPGSVNVELFKENLDMDISSIIRRTVLKYANPLTAIYDKRICDKNKDFVDELKAKELDKDSVIIVCCQEGLRGKIAADVMFMIGYNNVGYLDKGFAGDFKKNFESEGDYELHRAAVGGVGGFLIKSQSIATIGITLLSLYGFLEFFPDQATEILRILYSTSS